MPTRVTKSGCACVRGATAAAFAPPSLNAAISSSIFLQAFDADG